MSFASPLFLWYFLPGLLLLYWCCPGASATSCLGREPGLYSVGGGSFVLGLLASWS
jgi:hypothetical protein